MGNKKSDPVVIVDETQVVEKKAPKKKDAPLDDKEKKTPKPAANLDPEMDTESETTDDKELEKLEEEIKNEVAVRNTKAEIKDLVDKVYKYCLVQSGIDLYPYQEPFAKRIIESIILNDGDEVTALFSRQSGKTEAVSCILGGLMVLLPILAKLMPENENLQQFKDGVLVGIFAPSKEQAHTAFTRLKQRLTSKNAKLVLSDPDIAVDFESEKGNPIVLTNGSLCRMQTAAKQSQIESKTYHILWIDETQDVDDMKLKKSIHPMGASTNATLIKIGTPNTKKSSFYDTIRRNIRQQGEFGGKQNHFQADYKEVEKYNPRYRKYIEKEIDRLGYDSDEFRMAYRLHFILERGMFVTEDVLKETYNVKLQLKESSREPCAAGIDVAKSKDSTVVTVLELDWENAYTNEQTGETYPYKKLIGWLELHGENHEVQFHEIMEFLGNYNIQTIFIDATGQGDAVADRFVYALPDVHVEPYTFSRPAKSEMWKALSREILARRVEIPYHSRTRRLRTFKRFEAQMLDLEKDYAGQHMVCKHPDAKGAHDDYCDSFGLANLAAESGFMPEIEEDDNPLYANYRRW